VLHVLHVLFLLYLLYLLYTHLFMRVVCVAPSGRRVQLMRPTYKGFVSSL